MDRYSRRRASNQYDEPLPEKSNTVQTPLHEQYFKRRKEILAKKEDKLDTQPGEKAKPKGVCSKCGKVIGRGLYFHEKHCKGDE